MNYLDIFLLKNYSFMVNSLLNSTIKRTYFYYKLIFVVLHIIIVEIFINTFFTINKEKINNIFFFFY